MKRMTISVLLGALIAAGGGAVGARGEAASVWYVAPSGQDTNSCLVATEPCATPNAAIAKAVAGDTVRIAVGRYTGTGGPVITLNKSLMLEGGWNSAFTAREGLSSIDGEGARQGLVVPAGVTASVQRLLIEDGAAVLAPLGGGGIQNSGSLTVDSSTIRGNKDSGIVNLGALILTNSTVSGNATNLSSQGGGITSSSLASYVTTVVSNSTISGNSASEGGGIAIRMPAGSGQASVSLNNVTITGNTAWGGTGGGVLVEWNTQLSLQNSIVAKNMAYFVGDIAVRGGLATSAGYNVLGNTSGFASGPGDVYGQSPLLGPLQPNGGPTESHALQPGSPAIDGGNPAGCSDGISGQLLTTDQRGAPRPYGIACDSGAYEFGAVIDETPPVITAPAEVVANATDPDGTTVSYTVTVIDNLDPSPTLSCAPPSGSLFTIGTTTVACTAADAAGNTANAHLDVRVKGAVEQLADLRRAVIGLGRGSSLADKVEEAQASLSQHDVTKTCTTLDTFIREVQALSGKSIPSETATALIVDASRIMTVLGC